MTTDKTQKKRKQVRLACTACRKAKTACDETRPCKRCVAKGCGDTCVDAPKKRRTNKKSTISKSSVLAAKKAHQNPPLTHNNTTTKQQIETRSKDEEKQINFEVNPFDQLCFFPPSSNFPSQTIEPEPLQFRTVTEPESFDPFQNSESSLAKKPSHSDIFGSRGLFNTPSMECMLHSLTKELDSSSVCH